MAAGGLVYNQQNFMFVAETEFRQPFDTFNEDKDMQSAVSWSVRMRIKARPRNASGVCWFVMRLPPPSPLFAAFEALV